jgi:hypothetical protein
MAASKPKLAAGSGGGGGRAGFAFGFSGAPKGDASYSRRRMDRVPTSIPRNLNSQLVWDSVIFSNNTVTAGVALQENNVSFTLSNHPQAAQWTALYDQYVLVEVRAKYSVLDAPGSTTGTGVFYTALDLDNSASLGSVSSIQSYGTCMLHNAKPGLQVVRVVRPCVASSVGPNTLGGSIRCWLDCAYNSTPHYAHRFMTDVTTAAAYQVKIEFQMIFSFRSSI